MNKKQTKYYNDAKAIIENKNGKLMSDKYINAHHKLEIKCCKDRHGLFTTSLNKLKTGRWCPKCKGEKTAIRCRNNNGLEEARKICECKGFSLLSIYYKNAFTKLEIQCSIHGIFFMNLSSLKKGCGCPSCGTQKIAEQTKNKNGLEEARKICEVKNAFLLSRIYKNAYTKLEIQCPTHGMFFMNLSSLKNGRWCSFCGDERMAQQRKNPNGLNDAQNIANNYNGFILSTEYKNANSKLLCKCKNNEHDIFSMSLSTLRRGQWCKECRKNNLSENRARLFIEMFFKKQFFNCRPQWNTNPLTGRLLELDIYNKELNIAFEYDGHLHYEKNTRIEDEQKQQNAFSNIIVNDFIKEQNCKANNVALYRIKHNKNTNSFRLFSKHIINELAEQGLHLSYTDDEMVELKNKFRKI